MEIKYEPKFKQSDIVLYKLEQLDTQNRLHSTQSIELIIISFDQWLNEDMCWLYSAISRKTSQKVYVKESELTLK
tara:strand:+ start:339 stop:563 length:225 start_codon:yes stop_codon:yes gene_type:complete